MSRDKSNFSKEKLRETMQEENVDLDGNPILDKKDMERVEQYLSNDIHQVERRPFRPLYFTFLSMGSVATLLFLALLMTWMAGIPDAYLERIWGPYGG